MPRSRTRQREVGAARVRHHEHDGVRPLRVEHRGRVLVAAGEAEVRGEGPRARGLDVAAAGELERGVRPAVERERGAVRAGRVLAAAHEAELHGRHPPLPRASASAGPRPPRAPVSTTSKSEPLTRLSVSSPFEPAVRRDRHQPVAAVVRHEHAVGLQPLEDGARVLREAGDVEVAAQPEALAHAREGLVEVRARPVRGGQHVAAPRAAHREAHRVLDLAALALVVAHDGREDRQARRRPTRSSARAAARPSSGRTSPRSRPASRRRSSAPARTRTACRSTGSTTRTCRSPLPFLCRSSSVWPGFVTAFMSSLTRERPVLDRRVVGHRVGPGVRLVRVVDELHRHALLVGRHQDEAHVEVVAEASCRRRSRRRSRPSPSPPASRRRPGSTGCPAGRPAAPRGSGPPPASRTSRAP